MEKTITKTTLMCDGCKKQITIDGSSMSFIDLVSKTGFIRIDFITKNEQDSGFLSCSKECDRKVLEKIHQLEIDKQLEKIENERRQYCQKVIKN